MVEVLRGFDTLWGHWDVSMTISFRPHYGPGVDLAPDRDMCCGVPVCGAAQADCLETVGTLTPAAPRPCAGLLWIDLPFIIGDRSSAVVKVLCYKSEVLWFEPRWCHWNFSLT